MRLIRVFTYGTLKPGEVNHRVCAAEVLESQPAIALGRLYHLPFDYPAMTLEESGLVQGDLLIFRQSDILHRLDEFEQHDPETFKRVAPGQTLALNQYCRQLLPIFTPGQIPLEPAWGYVMTREQIRRLQGQPVSDGCWKGLGRGYKR